MDSQNLLTIGLVLVFAVMIFFMFRNSRKRRRDQEDMQAKLVPGTEVMTSHGIYGTIVSIDDDKNEAVIETTPGTRLRLHRQTLTRVVEPTESADESPVDAEVPDDASSLTADSDGPIDSRPSYELNPDASSTSSSAGPSATEPEYGERTESEKPKRAPRKKATE